jgi:hypothetical protein
MGKGGGGGGSTKTTSTVYNSSLPLYAKPYYEKMMNRAQTASAMPYVPFQGERLAPFSVDTENYMQGVRSMEQPEGLGEAQGATNYGINAAYGMNYNPNSFQGGEFGGAEAQKYMNPYIQNVLDVQKSRALSAFGEQQADRNDAAIRANAFGGSGRAVRDAMARRDLNSQLQQMDAEGMFKAYDTASQLFERDRAARLQAEQMGEQSAQFGAEHGLEAIKTGLSGAQQLAGMSELEQKMFLDRLAAQKDVGTMQDQLAQRALDIGYEDFINQRDWGKQQISWLSSILHGVPISANSNVTQTAPAPGLGQQALGAGLGIYGLSQAQGND